MPIRELIIPGDHEETLHYAAGHFINCCREAIQDHGIFYVALSGGSTPKAVYTLLTTPPYNSEVEWEKIHFFWSDERNVSSSDKESNFHMAMEAGLKNMPIPEEHIHRMKAEREIEKHAQEYEHKIREILEDQSFDLVMLGMGEDGHTASLFPGTEALKIGDRLVAPNYIPSKKSWRMTLTLECINAARHVVFYVMGVSKKEMLKKVFTTSSKFPCQYVGTEENPALWIVDEEAMFTEENDPYR